MIFKNTPNPDSITPIISRVNYAVKIVYLFFVVFLLSFPNTSLSQGCSDAGFCNMGALANSEARDSTYLHIATLSGSLGVGEQSVLIYQVIPELQLRIFKHYTIQARWPYVLSNGNLGGTGGSGDALLSLSRTFKDTWAFTAGARLATGSTHEVKSEEERRPMPMPYQPGLGSTDLIAGLSWEKNGLHISSGIQAVLNHNNKNRFLHSRWEGIAAAQKYFESNKLKRGSDVLLRAEYAFNLGKYRINGGLLSLYRLEEDQVADENNVYSAIEGSDGLTLNYNVGVARPLGQQDRMAFLIASPLIVRDVRPDGLTRSLVVSLSYQILFGY